MRRIYKYPLEVCDKQAMDLPVGSVVISVGLDPSDVLCIWALVDPEAPMESVKFWIFGTGHPVPDGFAEKFIGTVRQEEFMWHVFTEPRVTFR